MQGSRLQPKWSQMREFFENVRVKFRSGLICVSACLRTDGGFGFQAQVKKCFLNSGGQSTQIKYLSKSTDTYTKILLQ